MNLLLKIISILITFFGAYVFGFFRGNKLQQNEKLGQENNELKENINILRKSRVNNFDDNANFLLSKQKGNKDK